MTAVCTLAVYAKSERGHHSALRELQSVECCKRVKIETEFKGLTTSN